MLGKILNIEKRLYGNLINLQIHNTASALRNTFNWKSKISLDNGIINTQEWIENNLTKLSVVLNGVDASRSGYGRKYSYGYHYGYGYGYGYGFGSKTYSSYYTDDDFTNKKSIFERIKSFIRKYDRSKNKT